MWSRMLRLLSDSSHASAELFRNLGDGAYALIDLIDCVEMRKTETYSSLGLSPQCLVHERRAMGAGARANVIAVRQQIGDKR